MNIEPGDIVGFSSCDATGFWVNIGTLGIPFWSISHVAIAAAHPNTGRVLLFESTSECPLLCAIQKRAISGVQAHYSGARINTYRGKIWHYQLRKPLTAEQSVLLTESCVSYLGVSYDKIGAFRSRATPWSWLERHWRPESLQALFCSEYCAAMEREIGVFPTGDASKWNPNSFVRALSNRAIVKMPGRLK